MADRTGNFRIGGDAAANGRASRAGWQDRCMSFLLIRHGQSDNNQLYSLAGDPAQRVPDPGLTDLGRLQAGRLAAHFTSGALPTPTALLTSPMRRAVATAAPIAEALELPLLAHTGLHEVNGVYEGVYQGHLTRGVPHPGSPAAVLRGLSPRLELPPEVDEGGWYRRPFETPAAAWQRAVEVHDELVHRFAPGELVAVVTHAWFIQYLVRAFLGWSPGPDAELSAWLEINNTGHVLIDLAAPDAPVALGWVNRTDHLAAGELTR